MIERKNPEGVLYRKIKGYKYQTLADYRVQTPIRPDGNLPIRTDYIALDLDGTLWIKARYCWDGCSGPTWDDKTNMRGGLIHDALCQLLRMGMLAAYKKTAIDAFFAAVCKEDGMSGGWKTARRKVYHLGARVGGFLGIGTTPKQSDKLQLFEAP